MSIPEFTAESSLFGSDISYMFSLKYAKLLVTSQANKVSSYKKWSIPKQHTEPAGSGRAAWMDFEKACNNLQCKDCRKDCMSFVNGLHDAINIELGKSVKTPNDLLYLRDFINEMSKNAFG